MTTTADRLHYGYKVHGLVLASEIELPELAARQVALAVPADVHIRLGQAEKPANARPGKKIAVASNGAVFVELPQIARFLVSHGRDVVVEPQCSDPALIRVYLLGWIMTIVCQQRDGVVLHASAVAFGDRVVVFMGDQGAGKSTLAAHCVQAGANLVADDLLRVELANHGRPVAYPGMPLLKLWRHTLDGMGRDVAELARAWWWEDKFLAPFPNQTAEHVLPIADIYVLEHDDTAGAGSFEQLAGAAAVSALIANSHAIHIMDMIGRRPLHLRDCVRLAGGVDIARLRRRRDPAQLPITAALLARRL